MEIDEKSLALKEVYFTRKGRDTRLAVKLLPRKEAIIFLKGENIRGIINMDQISYEQNSDCNMNIVEKSFAMYYFKKEIQYDVDMNFNWTEMGKCIEIEHMLNQISKE